MTLCVLSFQDIPQPILFIVATALWGAFFIAWFLNFVIIRVGSCLILHHSVPPSSPFLFLFQQPVSKLHISISVFIVVKLIIVIYLMLYWLEMDKIGVVETSVVFGFYAVKIMFVSSSSHLKETLLMFWFLETTSPQ